MEQEVFTGEVVWFSRGIGFISHVDRDLFVHWKNIVKDGYKTLHKGQKVSFQLGENHKGVQAVNVKVI